MAWKLAPAGSAAGCAHVGEPQLMALQPGHRQGGHVPGRAGEQYFQGDSFLAAARSERAAGSRARARRIQSRRFSGIMA